MQTSKGQRMKKIRQSTVEPVIGTLVNYFAMCKVNTKGIKQANKCMIMSAVAYNIKKMMKWINRKTKIYAVSIEKIREKTVSKQIFRIKNLLAYSNNRLNKSLALNTWLI